VELLVRDLRCATKRFVVNLRAGVFGKDSKEDIGFSRVPDAYRIESKTQEVFVYEVEVGHPLKTAAILDYVHLWSYLDFYDWTLRLITVDRFAEPTERDLQQLVIPVLGASA